MQQIHNWLHDVTRVHNTECNAVEFAWISRRIFSSQSRMRRLLLRSAITKFKKAAFTTKSGIECTWGVYIPLERLPASNRLCRSRWKSVWFANGSKSCVNIAVDRRWTNTNSNDMHGLHSNWSCAPSALRSSSTVKSTRGPETRLLPSSANSYRKISLPGRKIQKKNGWGGVFQRVRWARSYHFQLVKNCRHKRGAAKQIEE